MLKSRRACMLSSLLLSQISPKRLSKNHKIEDNDLFLQPYHANSSASNLNMHIIDPSRSGNDSPLTNTSSSSQNRIMIVDDEHDIAKLFAITLEDNGFVVDVFNDPLSALSNYKAGLYDLLLLDIRMPGMNGYELYKKIKDIDDKAQVCFITAYEEYLKDFNRLFPNLEEVDCFVRKPVEPHNLVKIVKSRVK